MAENPRLIAAIDFILNHAGPGDLDAIAGALERRGNQSASGLNFQELAGNITRGLSERFKTPDNVNQITRNMVKGMIRTHEPNISDQDLEILLDKWIPSAQQLRAGQEQKYPPDVIYSMADQFVQYGIGNMAEKELKELKALMPDWHEKYWNVFSPVIRTLIADTIRGNVDLADFRARLRAHLKF